MITLYDQVRYLFGTVCDQSMISVYVSHPTTRVMVDVAVYVFHTVDPVVVFVVQAVKSFQYDTVPIRSTGQASIFELVLHPVPGGLPVYTWVRLL